MSMNRPPGPGVDHVWESILVLDARRPEIAAVLADVHRLHGWLLKAFPILPAATHQARRVCGLLHRLDWAGPGQAVLRARSRLRPAWPAQAGVTILQVATVPLDSWPMDPVPFICDANPVRRRRVPRVGQRDRVVREPLPPDAWAAWWARQTPRIGCALTAPVRITALGRRTGSNGAVAEVVRFEGELRIVDAIAWAAAYADGVGPAKAYGCGLIDIADALPVQGSIRPGPV